MQYGCVPFDCRQAGLRQVPWPRRCQTESGVAAVAVHLQGRRFPRFVHSPFCTWWSMSLLCRCSSVRTWILDIISWTFVSGSLLFEAARLEYWYAFYLGDDFRISLRIQLRLVRQCLHVHVSPLGVGDKVMDVPFVCNVWCGRDSA